MVLIEDLKAYGKMSATERNTGRGREIRAEIEQQMQWMPRKWRRLIQCRYFLRYSVTRTAIEIHVHRNTVLNWTRELTRWLANRKEYLEEIT